MAERKPRGGQRGSRLEPSEIVESLVPDSGDVPELLVLEGLLGRAARDGAWRIYTRDDLTEYVEFDEVDVAYVAECGRDKQVWLPRSASMRRVVLRRGEADYLAGPIAEAAAWGAPESFGQPVPVGPPWPGHPPAGSPHQIYYPPALTACYACPSKTRRCSFPC